MSRSAGFHPCDERVNRAEWAALPCIALGNASAGRERCTLVISQCRTGDQGIGQILSGGQFIAKGGLVEVERVAKVDDGYGATRRNHGNEGKRDRAPVLASQFLT